MRRTSSPTPLVDWIDRQPQKKLIAVGYLLFVLLAILDFLISDKMNMLIFYSIPVAIVTFVGTRHGLALTFLSLVTWLGVNSLEIMMGRESFDNPWMTIQFVAYFLLVTAMIAAMREVIEEEKTLARRDPLTGLPNRRNFYELLDIEVRRAKRYNRPITIVYIDIDNFKDINDTKGHAEGDKVLVDVANALLRNVRDTDLAARLGGDEFAILLTEADEIAARSAAANIRRALVDALSREGGTATPTMGVVTWNSIIHTVDAMIGEADRLMYLGKADGKNIVNFRTFGDDPVESPPLFGV